MSVIRNLISVSGFVLGVALGLGICAAVGEDPWTVLKVILNSAFGSRYDFGATLYYTTPLVFTGISVAIAYRAGLFNVGAEGQLNIAALAVAAAGIYLPAVPAPIAIVLGAVAALAVGGFWGWLPGFMKARFGSHEVISTIMLNFVSAAITTWLVTEYLQNPAIQSPETREIGRAFFVRTVDPVPTWFQEAPVNFSALLAVAWAVFFWILFRFTPLGYEIHAVGANPDAARAAGIDVKKIRQVAMFLAGASAGLVGLGEVLGFAGKYRLGFSPELGFMGIAVALLARGHPLAILVSAFGFAALHKGAADLDIETEFVTRDLSAVMQALVILLVAVGMGLSRSGKAGR